MKDLILESKLREWAKCMVNRYNWLTIRFEYNEERRRYLVSYFPYERICESDEFCMESSDFEDSINLEYLNHAPLFCDEERLFCLTNNAETFKKPMWLDRFYSSPVSCVSFIGGSIETMVDKSKINEYALAA